MSYLSQPINVSASGDTTVISATAGCPIHIRALVLAVDAATNVTIKDTNGATYSGAFPLAINGSLTLPLSEASWLRIDNGAGLVINQSGTAHVQGFVVYSRG